MAVQTGGAIGIFDSGFGGLTILKDIVRLLPGYDYIYLGDNARAPYGSRSFETVYEYTKEAVKLLFDKGCPLVILACNTASAKALRSIQQLDLPDWDASRRVLGIIRPTVESIPEVSVNGHVGILATRGTVVSYSYPLEIAKLHGEASLTVTQVECPLWVPLVENGETEGPGAEYFVKKYIDELFDQDPEIDTVILGCTHYPLLEGLISRYLPAGVRLLEQGKLVAASLKRYLGKHPEIERRLTQTGTVKYLTSEQSEYFERVAKAFVNGNICAEHIEFLL